MTRLHLAKRFQALAHFAQRNNRASVVAFGFRPGKQFPCFTLNSPHFVKQGFTEALFDRYVFIGGHACLIDSRYRVHDVIHFELNF